MTKLFIFDLDGTLADLTHRLHFIRNPMGPDTSTIKWNPSWKKDWNAFFDAVDKDAPIKWVMNLLDIVRHKGEILILSGRSQTTETKTRDWLRKHNILYDYLIMRPAKNHKPDYLIKRYMLEDFLRDKDFQVQFIVDDRESVVQMWRKNGYNVLQCQAWEDTDRQK